MRVFVGNTSRHLLYSNNHTHCKAIIVGCHQAGTVDEVTQSVLNMAYNRVIVLFVGISIVTLSGGNNAMLDYSMSLHK